MARNSENRTKREVLPEIKPGLKKCAGVFLSKTTCENWHDDHMSTRESSEDQECVCREQNRTSSGQLTLCSFPILLLPANYRYVLRLLSLFPARALLTDRSANSRRAIDVTGSWLSNGSGDPLSRYRPLDRSSPYLRSLESIAERLLLHYVDQASRANHGKFIWILND